MLKKLQIENLFGYKKIDIDFNKDLTFLIGRNGSGKTTVLNILSSLISGNVNFLLNYNFDSLKLYYKKNEKSHCIKLEKSNFDEFKLTWKEEEVIVKLEELKSHIRAKLSSSGTDPFYSEKLDFYESNAIFKGISDEFNNLYLPLSRDTGNEFINPRIRNQIQYRKMFYGLHGNIDKSLDYVNALIKEKQRTMMLEFEELNKIMQKEMLKSSFNFYSSQQFSYDNAEELMKVFKSKDELKQAFEEMQLLTEDFREEIDKFFDKLKTSYESYYDWLQNKDNPNREFNDNAIITFIENSSQIQRIIKWKEIIMKNNKTKSEIRKPMDDFLNTVNSYFEDSGKTLYLDENEGILKFSTKFEEKIPLHKLSSGEKQIVIFFAYLILGINTKKEGIYIVDEPELSLHIRWQQRFCDDIMRVAPNLQMIFATHSPEIVGKYRDKVVILGGDHA
ncbi:AAA family ATPase [Bacillus alveayuensis]|uniref:AAA family ATPase n=1 Tax=Aeribacillus alveayuensis TaxID=279215 RepID=UPI0005CD2586|nr:AAA family ATPase [Bacillus alveayuensis]